MPVCGKRITRKSRDGTKEITPTLSYNCELEQDHEGPCASPSDLTSAQARQDWELKDRRATELKRHQESGLGMTQSLPMPSASIVESDDTTEPQLKVGRRHPSEPVPCPFCPETPLAKNFANHVMTHQGEHTEEREQADFARSEVRRTLPSPPPSRPPMAPRASAGRAEPNQGITTIEDSRPVVGEEPMTYFTDAPAPEPEVMGIWEDERAENVVPPQPRPRLGINMATAVLEAFINDMTGVGAAPEVVTEAWDEVKRSLY